MSWNYRIVQHTRGDDSGGTYCQIHEVYYKPDGSIELWSTEGMAPFGEDATELKEDLELLLRAFNKPILYAEDLPGYKDD